MLKLTYYCDKETNNTYRFQPDVQSSYEVGQATIYIRKDALLKLGVKPTDGLVIEIKRVEDVK